ncbi:GGDEF domain-containing protein [Rubrivivax sp. A210]|nr:GGDEF domain-containing protein [Rubrivivax sp. A210]
MLVTSITNAELLLIVLLLLQSLFGLLWLGAARLRLARRPAQHWAAMAWLVAGGLTLILLRGRAPQWLSVGAGNGLVLAAFVTLRRGIQRFARLPTSDREYGLLMAIGVSSTLGMAFANLSPLAAVLLAAAAMAWTLLRGAGEIRDALATEFGRTAASWCALPMAMLAALFLVRAGVALVSPAGFQSYLQQPGGGGVAAAFVALVIALLVQANLIAMVLLRLVRRLQYRSDHDMLTGLLSRRPMEQMLLAESQRQRHFGQSFALLSIDIDHFKKINDGCGHAAGDAVLKRVAEALRDAARDSDSVARMGGEEFCVLLPGTEAAGANTGALRLLETVRDLHHPEIGGKPVTISIGMAVMEAPAEPIQALQRRLDQALYAAKAAGRDRIERAAPAASAPRTPSMPEDADRADTAVAA